MNIFEKIANLFKKRYKALPEATTYNEKAKDKSWILKGNMDSQQETKLDQDIGRFLESYYSLMEQIDTTYPIDERQLPRAYDALVRMNAEPVTRDEYSNNLFEENELLQEVYGQNRYNIDMQKNRAGRNVFYHIRSKGYQLPPDNEIIRIYVNCNNANIAELSKTILECNQNNNFYLKLSPNEENAINPRGEKIVIYCKENEFEYNMELLQYVKSIKPELFNGSEKTLPFLKNEDNIASVARQPLTNQYYDLYNRNRTIPQSHNTFLANILQDSYMETAREIARNDSNLSFLLDEQYENSRLWYVKNYPYINENYHDYLLKSMEAKMDMLSRKNNIYIDGLDYNNQYDRETGQTQELYEERY